MAHEICLRSASSPDLRLRLNAPVFKCASIKTIKLLGGFMEPFIAFDSHFHLWNGEEFQELSSTLWLERTLIKSQVVKVALITDGFIMARNAQQDMNKC